ncbi:hypothetical protein BLOT_000192 [Blomia tropicalis]|nr:hypothetical protein BLOT_000192 [Blomia tropicalis]
MAHICNSITISIAFTNYRRDKRTTFHRLLKIVSARNFITMKLYSVNDVLFVSQSITTYIFVSIALGRHGTI